MLKTAEKKCFDQLSGASSTQKLVEKHNNSFHDPPPPCGARYDIWGNLKS